MTSNAKDAYDQAQKELAVEYYKEEVEYFKQKLREKRGSLWSRFMRFIKTKKLVIKWENK